jgi:hypothetical protein
MFFSLYFISLANDLITILGGSSLMMGLNDKMSERRARLGEMRNVRFSRKILREETTCK